MPGLFEGRMWCTVGAGDLGDRGPGREYVLPDDQKDSRSTRLNWCQRTFFPSVPFLFSFSLGKSSKSLIISSTQLQQHNYTDNSPVVREVHIWECYCALKNVYLGTPDGEHREGEEIVSGPGTVPFQDFPSTRLSARQKAVPGFRSRELISGWRDALGRVGRNWETLFPTVCSFLLWQWH